jgi:hypothetical protein
MGRFIQKKVTKGSQKWIQILINEKPEILNKQLLAKLSLPKDKKIEWLSPLKEDEYAEYRDEEALALLGLDIETFVYQPFWVEMGPQWDGIGRAGERVFLVEAKSHIPELISSMQAKKPNSIKTIRDSLEKTKKQLGSKADFDWTKTFYQYANRLAHVNFLKSFYIPAYLVCVYFVNDSEMKGPKSADEWKGAIRLVHRCLGLREHLLQKLIVDVFIDVTKLLRGENR